MSGTATQSGGIRAKLSRKLQGQGLDSAVTALSYFATAGLGFINGPILAYTLGPEGRGELAAVVATTQLIGFMLGFGMSRSAAFFADQVAWRKIIMSTWTSTLLFAVPFLIGLYPLYGWLLDGKQEITKEWFYIYLVSTLLYSASNTTVFWLRGMSRTVAFNILNALPALFTSMGYFGLFVAGELTLSTAFASTFVAQVAARTITLIYGRAWPGRGFEKAAFKQQTHYGFRAWFGSLSYLVTFRVDQFVLAGMVASAELGYYAVAATGATLSLPLSRGIGQTLLPHVRKAKTPERRIAAVDRAVGWTRIGSGVTLLTIAAGSPFLVPLLFGEDFRPAITPLLLLLPGQFANDIATVYASALDAFNRPEDASKAQVASAVVTVAGLAILAPIFGIEGAAMVTSLAYFAYLGWILRSYGKVKRAMLSGQPLAKSPATEAS